MLEKWNLNEIFGTKIVTYRVWKIFRKNLFLKSKEIFNNFRAKIIFFVRRNILFNFGSRIVMNFVHFFVFIHFRPILSTFYYFLPIFNLSKSQFFSDLQFFLIVNFFQFPISLVVNFFSIFKFFQVSIFNFFQFFIEFL